MHNQAKGEKREREGEREISFSFFFHSFSCLRNDDELNLLESRDVFNDVV
jgi:hypothetical protein